MSFQIPSSLRSPSEFYRIWLEMLVTPSQSVAWSRNEIPQPAKITSSPIKGGKPVPGVNWPRKTIPARFFLLLSPSWSEKKRIKKDWKTIWNVERLLGRGKKLCWTVVGQFLLLSVFWIFWQSAEVSSWKDRFLFDRWSWPMLDTWSNGCCGAPVTTGTGSNIDAA